MRHRLWADHQVAEYSVETIGRARTVHEWFLRAAKPDNHHLDNLVGCLVAASYKGIAAAAPTTDKTKPKRPAPARPKIAFNTW
jgi:hypothetical protein